MSKYLDEAVEKFDEMVYKIEYRRTILDYEIKEFLECIVKEAEARVMARLKVVLKEDDGDEV